MLIFLVFAAVSLFQSTHPVRGGTTEGDISAFRQGISIHPPREGWDDAFRFHLFAVLISIHPPREGWDIHLLVVDGVCNISIHPPREGWDLLQYPAACCFSYFNPPTP